MFWNANVLLRHSRLCLQQTLSLSDGISRQYRKNTKWYWYFRGTTCLLFGLCTVFHLLHQRPRLETLFCHFDQGLVVQTINYFLCNMNTKIVYVIHCLKFFYKYTCRTRQDSSYHLSCQLCWLTYSIKYNNINHLPLLKLHSAHLRHFATQL